MGRKPTGKPNGRPPIKVKYRLEEKEIILDQVIYWIGMQATAEEIASSFHTTIETLDSKLKEHFGMGFLDLKKRCDGSGKLSLRRYQFKQAEKSATMAIWLGKQWLGQMETPTEISVATETVTLFTNVMEQMKSLQSDSKTASTNESAVDKS